MIQDKEIVTIDNNWHGRLICFDDNIYVDLGMNNYIPVFDKDTGDILVTTQSKEILPIKNKNCNDRSSISTWQKFPEDIYNMPPPSLNSLLNND